MKHCIYNGSTRSPVNALLLFWVDWQVALLLVFTMSLQCFLVLTGFYRKQTSNPGLHASIWVAFLTLDACATYALGLMLSSGCDSVYSLFAPMCLFHLGAADAINAYAPTDNDLWLRYAFKMVLESVAAVFIVSRSSDCPDFRTSSILLLTVGIFKYWERIYALRCGSQAHILASARPIYTYMSTSRGQGELPLIVSGEKEWYRDFQASAKDNKKREQINETVTYDDIMQCQDLCNLMGREIVKRSCLAYALFKIFRRRLTNLRIHEKEEDFKTVRNVLLSLEVQHIRKVIDLELSFIFDAVYSKASSGIYYQGIGVITRLFTLTLLFTAVLDIIRLDKEHMPCSQSAEVPFGAGLANVLVIVALVVECLQIRKIVRSNWLRVWLVCNYVKQQNLGRSIKLHDFKRRAIACSFTYVGRPSSTHWKFRVGQLSILVDSLNLAWWHYIVQLEIEKACKVKNMQLQITNLLIDMDLEKLQDWLVCRMIKRSRALGKFRDICHLRQEIQVTFQRVQFNEVASLEDVILRFHVLTSLLESKLSDHSMILENNYVQITITLSRYCLHLMLKRPKLMPGDVDVAKFLYISVKQCLKDANIANVDKGRDLNFLCAEERKDSLPGMGLVDAEQQQQTNTSVEDTSNGAVCGSNIVGENILEFARRVADETEVSNKAEWKLLADVWLDILMYIINASDNAEPHIKQMAKGGELLTHLWVLLEHLGPCNQRHKASSCTT